MSKYAKIILVVVIVLALIGGAAWWLIRSRRPATPLIESRAGRQTDAVKAQQAIIKTLQSMQQTDHDLDGLSDADEAARRTDPSKPDTDADGLLDKDEIQIYKTNPLQYDTYGLGRSDGWGVRHRIILPNGKFIKS